MHEFDLGFYSLDKQYFILPGLLTPTEPKESEIIRSASQKSQFRFKYSYLSTTLINKVLIQFHHLAISYWKKGCILNIEDSKVLIIFYNDEMQLFITGNNKSRSDALTIIRHFIIKINKELSLKPDELIPLPDNQNYFANYQDIIAMKKGGRKTYPTTNPYKENDISLVLSGYQKIDVITNDLKEKLSDIEKKVTNTINKLKVIDSKISDIPSLLDRNISSIKHNLEVKKIEITQLIEKMILVNQEGINDLANEFEQIILSVFIDFDSELDRKFLNLKDQNSQTDIINHKMTVAIPLINLIGLEIKSEIDLKALFTKFYRYTNNNLFNQFQSALLG